MIQILCVQSTKRCKDREQEAEARKGSLGGEVLECVPSGEGG